MKTYEQTLIEKVELSKELRKFKRDQKRKNRIERITIVIVMCTFFGYLIWQVNRNLESQYIEIYTPVEVVKTRYIAVPAPTVQNVDEPDKTAVQLSNEAYELLEMDLPSEADGSFKTYMDYRTITNRSSKQWHLQQLAKTNDAGFRTFNGAYLVAMGSAYSTEIGELFRITTDQNESFIVMIGDLKKDVHTDPTNRFIESNGNIVEFIVDQKKMDPTALKMGDVSYAGLKGSIKKIEKIIN